MPLNYYAEDQFHITLGGLNQWLQTQHQTYRLAEAFSKTNSTWIRWFCSISDRLATAHKTRQCLDSCQFCILHSEGWQNYRRKRSKKLEPKEHRSTTVLSSQEDASLSLTEIFFQDNQVCVKPLFFSLGKKKPSHLLVRALKSIVQSLLHWNYDLGWLINLNQLQ